MLTERFPPEIYQLAKEYRLGEPLTKYETLPKKVRHFHFDLIIVVKIIWVGLFAAVTTFVLYAYFFAAVTAANGWIVLAWPLFWIVVLLVLGVDLVHTSFQKTSLYHCTEGLLEYNGQNRDIRVVPWEKMKAVWSRSFEISSQAGSEAAKFWVDWTYTFQLIDGKKYIFQGKSGMQRLSYVVDQELLTRFLPTAKVAYEAGSPVIFGDIIVSKQGIQIADQQVAWKHIFSVDIEGEMFIVRFPDWEHWKGIEKANIPNVCVLEALINSILPPPPRKYRRGIL